MILVCLLTSCEKILIGPVEKNTPENNFEILWHEFDRSYALFDVKKVDWNAMYNKYRPMVKSNTSNDELWNIITQMLETLKDPHTVLFDITPSKYYVSGHNDFRNMEDFSLNVVINNYLGQEFSQNSNGYLVYGHVPGHSIGYLYIASFGSDDKWPKDIDAIIENLSAYKTLIVDIRANGGGPTWNNQYLISAFIDHKIEYIKWKSRSGPQHNDFESPTILSVEPRKGKKQFTGNIALLTNRYSGSSSDHFTYVLKNLPNVVQIGDTTVGNFGTMSNGRQLPNGWTYNFTARLATRMDDVALDSLGGQVPDILIINKKINIQAGQDKVMEKAIEILSK